MKRKYLHLLAVGFLLTLGSVFSFSAFAKSPSINLPTNSHVLFIQVASSGELTPSKGDSDTYNLTLKKVDPFTSYFTDRPVRDTGILATNQFFNIWQNQADLKNSPPNVAVETSNIKNGHRINAVFELTNPVYNAQKHEVTYTAKLLSNKDKKAIPSSSVSIGYTVLFIDDFNWNGNQFG